MRVWKQAAVRGTLSLSSTWNVLFWWKIVFFARIPGTGAALLMLIYAATLAHGSAAAPSVTGLLLVLCVHWAAAGKKVRTRDAVHTLLILFQFSKVRCRPASQWVSERARQGNLCLCLPKAKTRRWDIMRRRATQLFGPRVERERHLFGFRDRNFCRRCVTPEASFVSVQGLSGICITKCNFQLKLNS